jgi:TAG lipase / lysophosphatidylethanolamine acyltransferase
LKQLDSLGYLPSSIRRFLLDEDVPDDSLTVVPDLNLSDFMKLLENPTPERIDYWIRRGERSVWPAIAALKVRCAVEVELDRGYQLVRRRKPLDAVAMEGPSKMNESRKKQKRAQSMGSG